MRQVERSGSSYVGVAGVQTAKELRQLQEFASRFEFLPQIVAGLLVSVSSLGGENGLAEPLVRTFNVLRDMLAETASDQLARVRCVIQLCGWREDDELDSALQRMTQRPLSYAGLQVNGNHWPKPLMLRRFVERYCACNGHPPWLILQISPQMLAGGGSGLGAKLKDYGAVGLTHALLYCHPLKLRQDPGRYEPIINRIVELLPGVTPGVAGGLAADVIDVLGVLMVKHPYLFVDARQRLIKDSTPADASLWARPEGYDPPTASAVVWRQLDRPQNRQILDMDKVRNYLGALNELYWGIAQRPMSPI